MILKVTLAQSVCDYDKRFLQKTKDELSKKKSTSFASILQNAIKSKCASR